MDNYSSLSAMYDQRTNFNLSTMRKPDVTIADETTTIDNTQSTSTSTSPTFSSLTTYLSDNIVYIGGGIAAVVVLYKLMK